MLQQLKLSMENELIKHTAQERSGRSFIIKKLPIQFAWARLISKMIMRNGTNILLHDTPAHFVHTYIHIYIYLFILLKTPLNVVVLPKRFKYLYTYHLLTFLFFAETVCSNEQGKKRIQHAQRSNNRERIKQMKW